jgi:hypothetical protein
MSEHEQMQTAQYARDYSSVREEIEAARAIAANIVAAPAEWTPAYTRSELLPLAKAYLARFVNGAQA